MSFSMTKERRDLFRMVLALSWPAILEETSRTIVQYVDTAMVGQIGAEASAAVGLTTSVMWLINAVMNALGIGLVAYVSRNMGAGRPEQVKKASVQAFYISIFLGVVLGVITLAVADKVPVWMNASEEIVEDAAAYFAIVCFPMLFRAFNTIYGCLLRGVGQMRSPMVINAVMNLINIIINFLLIYPSRTIRLGSMEIAMWGAGMGVKGAAWGTSIAFMIGGVLMFAAAQRNCYVSMRGARLVLDKGVLTSLLRVGLPVMLQRVTSCLGYVVFGSLVAVLGTMRLAAHSIAIQAEELFYIAGYGIQSAASTLAGNALGENDQKKFVSLTKILTALSMAIMTVSGIVLFAAAPWLMNFFTKDAEVIAAGTTVLRMVAFTEPFFGLMVVFEGIYNGIGDPKPTFIYALISMWGVRIVGTMICVHVLQLGLEAVWVCMILDNLLKAGLMTLRFVRGKWKRRFVE